MTLRDELGENASINFRREPLIVSPPRVQVRVRNARVRRLRLLPYLLRTRFKLLNEVHLIKLAHDIEERVLSSVYA